MTRPRQDRETKTKKSINLQKADKVLSFIFCLGDPRFSEMKLCVKVQVGEIKSNCNLFLLKIKLLFIIKINKLLP